MNSLATFISQSTCSLTDLNISYNNLSQKAINEIALPIANSSITKLDLSHIRLKDDKFPEIEELLGPNSKIEWLSLSKSRFGDNAAKNLASVMRRNSTLKHIHLANN